MSHDIRTLEAELQLIKNSKTYKLSRLMSMMYRQPLKTSKKVVIKALKFRNLNPSQLMNSIGAGIIDPEFLKRNYSVWQSVHEPSLDDLKKQRTASLSFAKKPVISIITPVFNPPDDVLIELIESVQAQTYPYWQLCLGEFGGNEQSKAIIRRYADADDRITWKAFKDNAGISENSNLCLTLATGDYIALLDHDDTLSPDALYENALLINQDDYDFIYSDKDKITEDGLRYEPMFKPDWSPEILLTANYLTHLNVFKHSIMKKIGGWRKETDGAQDWDIFFRLIEESKKIGHIPKILYHWRVIASSTAMSIKTKPYALAGQKNAIESHLKRLGAAPAVVSHDNEGALTLTWKAQPQRPTIIVYGGVSQKDIEKLESATKSKVVSVDTLTADELEKQTLLASDTVIIVSSESIKSLQMNDIDQLAGWLSIPGVEIAAAQAYTPEGSFLDAGRLLCHNEPLYPLFSGATYIPGYLGYREWSRNVVVPPLETLAINKKGLLAFLKQATESDRNLLLEYSLYVFKKKKRAVVTPFVKTVGSSRPLAVSQSNKKQIASIIKKQGIDPYSNINFNPLLGTLTLSETKQDVANLLVEHLYHSPLQNQSKPLPVHTTETLMHFRYLYDDAAALKRVMHENRAHNLALERIQSAVWFVPSFDTMYAGLKNIFAFADQLSMLEKTQHIFVVLGGDSCENEKLAVHESFPALSKNIKFIGSDKFVRTQANSSFDIVFATLWTTVYESLKVKHASRRFIFLQDDESKFYAPGSLSAVAAETWNLGYWAIAGTQGLAEAYIQSTGKPAFALDSKLELDTYLAHKVKKQQAQPKRVLFYARPDMPRNGFELGITALRQLADTMGDAVDIVLAGAEFSAQELNLPSNITVAGKRPYAELPTFYGSFHAALFLMYSQHPGVFPLEMMASGVPLVINASQSTDWPSRYIDGQTCLVARSLPSDIAEKLYSLLTNDNLRANLTRSAKKFVTEFNNHSYSKQAETVIRLIKQGRADEK